MFDYFKYESRKKRKEKSERLIKEFQESDLEKGDITAIIIAAMITFLPAVLFVLIIFYIFIKWFMRM